MIITYYGAQFLKIQLGDLTIAVNPIGNDSKIKTAKFGADIGLISLHAPDFNGREAIAYGDRKPFIIEGPGEYEAKDVSIKGIAQKILYEKEEKINTIYVVSLEGVRLCFLGALESPDLDKETIEGIDVVDVLFIPVGMREKGTSGVLLPKEASKLGTTLEPGIIIPLYAGEEALKQFLKEEGAANTNTLEKLTLKKKDMEQKEGEIIVLRKT
ncbi:MAG: MBL fold metallo-hydrolase [Parcubacteria group bacterium]|nr:MBL fold metallo-hydrolase [Parcubacteria group bacterium]